MPAPDPHPAGFTLIEMTVVLVVLALTAGLVLTRAPIRGGAVDLRAGTSLVTGTLRLARAQAIMRDAPVQVRFDPAAGTIQLGGAAARRLPPGIRLAAGAGPIVFRPDGSTDGSTVELVGRSGTARIETSWLTGRVAVAGAGAGQRVAAP